MGGADPFEPSVIINSLDISSYTLDISATGGYTFGAIITIVIPTVILAIGIATYTARKKRH